MSGSPSWFDWSSWTPTTLGSRWWIRIWEEMKLWKGIEYLSNKWTWIPLWDEHEYPSQKIGLRFISISSKFPSTLLYRLYNCCCAKIIVAINLLRDIKGDMPTHTTSSSLRIVPLHLGKFSSILWMEAWKENSNRFRVAKKNGWFLGPPRNLQEDSTEWTPENLSI